MKKLKIPILSLVGAFLLLWGVGAILNYPMLLRLGDPLARIKGVKPAPPEKLCLRLLDINPEASEIPKLSEVRSALIGEGNIVVDSSYKLGATLYGADFKYDNRRALLAPAPAKIGYQLKVPEKARLHFSYGLQSRLKGKIGGGAEFSVIVETDDQRKTLFQDRLLPRKESYWMKTPSRRGSYYTQFFVGYREWEDSWHEADVDLGPYAGKEIRLWLVTEPVVVSPTGNFSVSFFGNPEILGERAAQDPKPLNVVVFMVDALRYRELAAYGREKGITPNLEAFAGNGTVMDKMIAAGDKTRISTMPFLTGRHFTNLGIPIESHYIDRELKKRFYDQRHPTLPSVFHAAGYQTAMIGSNGFVLPTSKIGMDFGFDEVIQQDRRNYRPADCIAATMDWLKLNRSRPFMLYVHFDAPHQSENPSPAYLLKALWHTKGDYRLNYLKYLAQIIYTDEVFGKFLKALAQLGLRENTLIVVTADHGRAIIGDHFYWNILSSGEIKKDDFDHGSLWEEVIRIPCFISGPPLYSSPRRVEQLVSNIDVFPTLVELALPDPQKILSDPQIQGKSFAGLLLGKSAPAFQGRQVAYTIGTLGDSLYRADGAHYVLRWPDMERVLLPSDKHKIMHILTEQLFEDKSDPLEKKNLIDTNQPLADEMRRAYASTKAGEIEKQYLNFILFNYKAGKITCEVSVNAGEIGRVSTLPLTGQAFQFEKIPGSSAGERIRFSFELSKIMNGLIFERPVEVFQLTYNGVPVPRENVHIGPFGLSFATPEQKTIKFEEIEEGENPDHYDRFLSTRMPSRLSNAEGVYLYQMSYQDWIRRTFSDRQLSGAVREMLKQWGYLK